MWEERSKIVGLLPLEALNVTTGMAKKIKLFYRIFINRPGADET